MHQNWLVKKPHAFCKESHFFGSLSCQSFGVTSDPEVRTYARTAEDRALVLATDGLWDVVDARRLLQCLAHTAWSADLLASRLVCREARLFAHSLL